jgi:hypothetical protein
MEKKLEVLKQAIEMNGWINVSLHGDRSKEEAETLSRELAESLNTSYGESKSRDCYWYEVGGDLRFRISVHYRETKEDEIRKLEQQLKALKEETA